MAQDQAEGRLAENILYFARALRAAGIQVGPSAVPVSYTHLDVYKRQHLVSVLARRAVAKATA